MQSFLDKLFGTKHRDHEAYLRILIESIPDSAIFFLDTDGRVADWNAGAERIKGYRALGHDPRA